MNELPFRLRQLRLKAGSITQKQLAEILGVGTTIIAEMEQGIRPLSDKAALAILKKFKYDIENDNYFDDLSNINMENKNIIKIPFYRASVSAGSGIYLDDNIEKDEMVFDIRYLKSAMPNINFNNINIFMVSGDSMTTPDGTGILNEDLLFVDITQKDISDGVYVYEANNELKVKQFINNPDNTLVIQSYNPKYKTEIFDKNNPPYNISVIGRVIWNITRGGDFNKYFNYLKSKS